MPSSLAVVALGSNLDDRAAHLREAEEVLLRLFPERFGASPVYETDPIGPSGQQPYYNQVVCFACPLTPEELLTLLKQTEQQLGRKPQPVRWTPREIDLDLIAFGDRVTATERLTLPHPETGNRPFVLRPLADLLPEWRHPEEGWTASDRLRELGEQVAGQVLRAVSSGSVA